MLPARAARRPAALAALLAALILAGAGCAKTPAAPAPAPDTGAAAPESAPVAPAPSAAAVDCANPYYGLKEGTRVEYESDAAGVKTAYALNVLAGMKFVYEFPANQFVFAQDIDCTDGSVKAHAFLNMGSATGMMKTESQKIEGEIMPKDVRKGSAWTTTYETKVTMQGQGAGTVMTMKVRTDSKAVGEEKVTVPAGTFTALKVESTSTSDVVIEGGPAVPASTTTATQWWAKGVGMVKSVTDAKNSSTTTVATKVVRP